MKVTEIHYSDWKWHFLKRFKDWRGGGFLSHWVPAVKIDAQDRCRRGEATRRLMGGTHEWLIMYINGGCWLSNLNDAVLVKSSTFIFAYLTFAYITKKKEWIYSANSRLVDHDFNMKLGSKRYFRSNLSIQRSKTFIGTIIIPWLEAFPVEKEAIYWKRSWAILWANVKRSSTPDPTSSKFLMVSRGSNETPSWTTGEDFTSSLVTQPVRKIPEGLEGSIEPINVHCWNGGSE